MFRIGFGEFRKSLNAVEAEWRHGGGDAFDLRGVERDQVGIAVHEVRNLRSVVTVAMSDESSTPRPSAPFPQCSMVPPGKWTPPRIKVTPGSSCSVSPSQCLSAESGRMIHCRSSACRWIGTPPQARLHSTLVV